MASTLEWTTREAKCPHCNANRLVNIGVEIDEGHVHEWIDVNQICDQLQPPVSHFCGFNFSMLSIDELLRPRATFRDMFGYAGTYIAQAVDTAIYEGYATAYVGNNSSVNGSSSGSVNIDDNGAYVISNEWVSDKAFFTRSEPQGEEDIAMPPERDLEL